VVIRKGLDLQGRDWTIYANDPDLDTVLAIWVLLNHLRLNDVDDEIRRKVMPLVRLEGAIDAHGLDMQEFCGFPLELQESVFADLEHLRSKEVALKKEGRWDKINFLEYTAGVLRSIDGMIYSSHHFEGVVKVEELARAEIGEKKLAIVCRAGLGIYEVEPHLRRLHGKRLGVIILQKNPNTYTLRQVDAFHPATLESAYERLNLIDPAAGSRRSDNRWGGSEGIGGSPRATGTSLSPQQIADAFAWAYRRPTAGQRLGVLALVLLGTTAVMLGSILATFFLGWLGDPTGSINGYFRTQAGIYAGVLSALSGVLTLAALRSGPKLFGLRLPVGFDWLALFPGALLGGLAGGAWIFAGPVTGSQILLKHHWTELAIAIGFPIAAEVLFRGLAHGMLAQRFPTQQCGGRWFLSWPILISSTLYALWSLPPFLPFFSGGVGVTFAAALLFGISSGIARERSESLLPCLILHWSCLLMLVMTRPFIDMPELIKKILHLWFS
jgi:Type II CAAX prenyl endopeptidase Rce1-like